MFPVQVIIEMCSWAIFYSGHVFSKALASLTYVLPTLLSPQKLGLTKALLSDSPGAQSAGSQLGLGTLKFSGIS